jgi:hypothetical protein
MGAQGYRISPFSRHLLGDRIGSGRPRRFSAACVLAEQLEADLANGHEVDVERYALLCSTLTRLAHRIGIDRRARTLNPTVADYLAGKGAETVTRSGGDVEGSID